MNTKKHATRCHWCGAITEVSKEQINSLRQYGKIKFTCQYCGVENAIKAKLDKTTKRYVAEEIYLGKEGSYGKYDGKGVLNES